MTVAFDAKVTSSSDVTAAAAMTNTTLTVGSGSNRALIALIAWTTGTLPTGITLNWDNTGTPQPMTLITGTSIGDAASGISLQLYGLVAPTPGNKTLAASWTGSREAHLAAVSFTGVDQTGGATSFPHGNTNTGTATSSTITIPSATGNMVVAMSGQTAAFPTSTSGTTISLDPTGGPNFAAATLYDNGAASVICTTAWGGANIQYVMDGCDIAAAAVGTAPFPLLGQIWV